MSSLLEKYGVVHKIATPYHPQTNDQAEVFNKEIKKFLLKMVIPTYQTPLGMSPYQIVFRKACHLLAEIEHKAYWAVKKCNITYDQARKKRTLQLQELEELCLKAYENSRIYKQKVKQFHDNQILKKEFTVGQKVLLFHSRLKLIANKLRSRRDKPFVIINVFSYGALEVQDETNNKTFQVNGHQIKHFYEGLTPIVGEVENISLLESAKPDDTL
ncbi:hypothetical protein CR513_19104, partial [Mucuna pruriens]